MRRFSLVVVAVLSFALAASFAEAQSNTYLKTVKLSFVEPGALASTAKDTMFVTDEADTARSLPIDLSDMDWAGTLAQGSVATGYPIAKVTFVATRGNSGGFPDTLYWNIERGVDGLVPSSSFAGARPDTVYAYNPLAVVSGYGSTSSGWSTVEDAGTALGGLAQHSVYVGWIYVDPDLRDRSGLSAANYLLRRFRLVTAGDVGATSPKLSGVMGFITYLAKR